jgi:hypothetical protein
MFFQNVVSGERTGVTSATQLPDVPCRGVYLRASAGTVYVGGPGVTVPDGVTDVTSGMRLPATDTTPLYLPVSNLNCVYVICDAVTSHIQYVAVR